MLKVFPIPTFSVLNCFKTIFHNILFLRRRRRLWSGVRGRMYSNYDSTVDRFSSRRIMLTVGIAAHRGGKSFFASIFFIKICAID